MIRVREKTILLNINFSKENSAMEQAFIQGFLVERFSARQKSDTLFEIDVEYPDLDGIQEIVEGIEIYLEEGKDRVVLYYFLPTGINGRNKFYQTTIGQPYGMNPDTNPLGL